jgi:hypothetical protein
VATEKLPNDRNAIYAEPTRGLDGNQKYIVRPSEIPFVTGVHEVGHDEQVAFMTGRTMDHQDARVMHFRVSKGLHADTDPIRCKHVPPRINNGTAPCPSFIYDGNKCQENFMDGEAVYELTEVNRILSGFPISAQTEHFYNEAVCYAERYPELKQRFCINGDTNFCNTERLWRHYDKKENPTTEERTYGCQDSVKNLLQHNKHHI